MPKVKPRIAVVYDHLLTTYGGAEQVLIAVLQAFPEAELFSTIQDAKHTNWHLKTKVHLSFLQKIFPLTQHREVLDVVTPITIEQFDLSTFDIVISVTSSAVKGILTQPSQLHICYLLSPTRYLYDSATELLNQHQFLSLPGLKWATTTILRYLRWWDQVAIWRPDYLVAISNQVAARSLKSYGRKVDAIIYPPVPILENTKTHSLNLPNNNYLLCVSRLVAYKRIDLAIQAARVVRMQLVVAGTGRELQNLIASAADAAYIRGAHESLASALESAQATGKQIVFMGACTTDEKELLLENCSAAIMPGIEDFGISAMEAVGHGKQVIIAAESGVAELLTDGELALHYAGQHVENLIGAIKKLEYFKHDPSILKSKVSQFSQDEFVRKFHNLVFAFYREHSTIKQ